MAKVRMLLALLVAAHLWVSLVCSAPDEAQEPQKFIWARPVEEVHVGKIGREAEETGFVKVWLVRRAFYHPHTVERIRDVKAQNKKLPDGLLRKAWAYVIGFANPLGNARRFPTHLPERKKVSPAEGKSHGDRHRHKREPPEEGHAVAATEPLADESFPPAQFATKLTDVVRTVLEDYHAATVVPEEKSACVGVLEEQVKTLFLSLESALHEQMCGDVAASEPAQEFVEDGCFCVNFVAVCLDEKCNLLNSHSKVATLMVLRKGDVNLVTAALTKTSTAGICNEEDRGKVLDSLHLVEELAQFRPPDIPAKGEHRIFHERSDGTRGLDLEKPVHEPGVFAKHKPEHGRGLVHWSSVFWKGRHDGDEHPHPHPHPHDYHRFEMFSKHELEHKDDHVLRGFHMFLNKFKKHNQRLKPHEPESGRGMLRRHWWRRGRKEVGSDDGDSDDDPVEMSCEDCFRKGIHHLAKGISKHIAKACHLATEPKLVAACKFAKEHKGLAKAHLAVKIPIWEIAGFHCAKRRLRYDFMFKGFHKNHGLAPHIEVHRVPEFARPFVGRLRVHVEPGMDVLISGPRERPLRRWRSGRCARHQANQAFKTAMQLRGHVVGLSQDNHGEVDLLGFVRTQLVVLNGVSLSSENFQDALVNAPPLVHSLVRDMPTDFQSEVRRAVDAASSSDSEFRPELKSDVLFKILHLDEGWKGVPNFRISARPRIIPAAADRQERATALDKEDSGLPWSIRKYADDGEPRIEGTDKAHGTDEGGRAQM